VTAAGARIGLFRLTGLTILTWASAHAVKSIVNSWRKKMDTEHRMIEDLIGINDIPPEQDCYFAAQEIMEAMKRKEFTGIDKTILRMAVEILKNAAGNEYAHL
jgi:hypothetical protein